MWEVAAQVGGSLISGLLSNKGASDQNAANSALAQRQMDFQREMSNTAYQRSMADMKAAGLNPILAYKTGGATTPGGASAQAVNEMEGSANSARNAAQQIAQINQVKAQTDLVKQQSKIASRDAFIKGVQADALKWGYNKAEGMFNSAKEIERRDLPDLTPKNSAKGSYNVKTVGPSLVEKGINSVGSYLQRLLKNIYDEATK
ncbi:DNA pilot protein [Microviridae sp.]|nr:DNA pilot protein [Microviridae sp.]